MDKIHIDIETYSDVPIKTAGSYKYMESKEFKILLIGFRINDEEVNVIDGQGDIRYFANLIRHKKYTLCAHNANFERNAFNRIGIHTDIDRWECTASKALYCGYPESLANASKALDLTDKKLDTGVALIKLFSVPDKNGNRTLPESAPAMWDEFKRYLTYDVLAESEIDKRLGHVVISDIEKSYYVIDQEINDRGVLIDPEFVKHADALSAASKELLLEHAKVKFGIKSLKSPSEIKEFIYNAAGLRCESLNKNTIPSILSDLDSLQESGKLDAEANELVHDLLDARKQANKTSTAKYTTLLNSVMADNRVRGMFRYYGANRTGRWAGRLAQLHNLPQNHLDDLDTPRDLAKFGDYEIFNVCYDNVTDVLSQLIRTAFVAPAGMVFAVSDFSAIEARVTAWLANEKWRMDAFKNGVDIYAASASMMFGKPISETGKGTEYRQRGKVAELALGYGGSVNALTVMDSKGVLKEDEKPIIVSKWREASQKIVYLWRELNSCAIKAVQNGCRYPVVIDRTSRIFVDFDKARKVMIIELPSKRCLYYPEARVGLKQCSWGESVAIFYHGVHQQTGQWIELDTYGGKLTENVVQAISRDLLCNAMAKVRGLGYDIVMHVHDEIIAEIPSEFAEQTLGRISKVMCDAPDWAAGLILNAEGYTTKYYKKD